MVQTHLQKIHKMLEKQITEIDAEIEQTYIDQRNIDLSLEEWKAIDVKRIQLSEDRDVISDLFSISLRHPIHADKERNYTVNWYKY